MPLRLTRETEAMPGGKPVRQVDIVNCDACGHAFQAAAAKFRAFEPSADISIEELVSRTNPKLPEYAAERIFHERIVIGGADPDADRRGWMQESIGLVEYIPARHHFEAQRGADRVGACVGFGIIIAGVILAGFIAGPRRDAAAAMTVVGSVVLAAIAALVTRAVVHRRRWQRGAANDLHRMLARSLRPLKPSEEELRELLAWCRVALPHISPLLELSRLHAAIRAERDSSLNNVDHLAHVYPFLRTTPEDIRRQRGDGDGGDREE